MLLHPRRRYALWPLPPHIPHTLTPTILFPYSFFAHHRLELPLARTCSRLSCSSFPSVSRRTLLCECRIMSQFAWIGANFLLSFWLDTVISGMRARQARRGPSAGGKGSRCQRRNCTNTHRRSAARKLANLVTCLLQLSNREYVTQFLTCWNSSRWCRHI